MISEIVIDTIKPEYAKPLEQLQREAFPTLADTELMVEDHFLNHCELFPDGNFVALCGEKVVGLGAGFLIDFDFDDPQHSFNDIIDEGYFSHHDPNGDWYYGADISVHPKYRKRGIGSRLYQARMGIVIDLNRKGIVAGGLIPDYVQYKDELDPHDYVEKVVQGELFDSTLSFQLSKGFRVRGLLKDYIVDEASDNWATLIVWRNPEYQPA